MHHDATNRSVMEQEIAEQPAILDRLIADRIPGTDGIVAFPEFLPYVDTLLRTEQAILIGCGSSSYAATVGNYYFEELAGLNAEVEYADEFIARQPVIPARTLVVLISQSGETADALSAARHARERGAFVIALVNAADSSLGKLSDVTLPLQAGKETAVAATKTFTAELLVLLLFAEYLAQVRSYRLAPPLTPLVRALPGQIRTIVDHPGAAIALANRYRKTHDLIFLGASYLYPIALEGAHKLKETAYVHAEGLPTGELKHGAMALVDPGTLMVFLAPKDRSYPQNVALLKEVHTIGAPTLVLTHEHTDDLKPAADDVWLIPAAHHLLMPIMMAVPLQLFACHMAKVRGLNVDRPRHLNKFVG